jgi:hypothetical protein
MYSDALFAAATPMSSHSRVGVCMQAGLIKVGEVTPPPSPSETMPPMNPNGRCSCCPNAPPQRFNFARLPNLRHSGSKTPHAQLEAVTQQMSYADGWAWYAANVA